MKKFFAFCLALLIPLCCLFGCSDSVKEYDKTPLTTLTYTRVDYNGGFTEEYLFDFEKMSQRSILICQRKKNMAK